MSTDEQRIGLTKHGMLQLDLSNLHSGQSGVLAWRKTVETITTDIVVAVLVYT